MHVVSARCAHASCARGDEVACGTAPKWGFDEPGVGCAWQVAREKNKNVIQLEKQWDKYAKGENREIILA